MPTKDIKNASIVEREYNKTIEQQGKHSILYGNLPTVIENEYEQFMHEFDTSPDLFRYEFSLRSAIIRFITKYNFPLFFETVMNEQFQKRVINDFIIQRGLHHQILSKREYQRVVKIIFKTNHSQGFAL